MSLARQLLPVEAPPLEPLENGHGTAPTSFSDIVTGWLLFERKSRNDEGEPTATTLREEGEDRAALGPPSTNASTTIRPEKDGNSVLGSREVSDVDDSLLKDLNLSQGIWRGVRHHVLLVSNRYLRF
jgi:hypothetical protein